MTEGDKAGLWAMAYLYMALVAVWFTIGCLTWYHFKQWFFGE